MGKIIIKDRSRLKKQITAIVGRSSANLDYFLNLYSSTGFINGNRNGKYFENLKKLIEEESFDLTAKKETLLKLLRYSFVVNDPITLYENILAGNNSFFIGSLETDILRADRSLTDRPVIFLPIILEGMSIFSNHDAKSIVHLLDIRNIVNKNDTKSAIYRNFELPKLLKKQKDFEANLSLLLRATFKNVSLINIHNRFTGDGEFTNIYDHFSRKLKERVSSVNFWRSLPQPILNQTNTSLTDAGKIVFSEIKDLNLYKAYRDIDSYLISNITKNFLGYILPEFIISALSSYTDGAALLYGRFRYRELQQSFLRSVLISDHYQLSKMDINIKRLTPICYPVRPEADNAQDRTLVNTTFFNFQGNPNGDLRIGDSERNIISHLNKLHPNDIYVLIRKNFIPYWAAGNDLQSRMDTNNIIEAYAKIDEIHRKKTINNHKIFINFIESILLINKKYSDLFL
jgi:hypothetical protein